MTFLDSKGRLFGKVNIIDLLIIIGIIVALVVGIKLVFKLALIGSEIQWINITMKFENVDPSIADSIKIGDIQLDIKKDIIANITSIDRTPRDNPPFEDLILNLQILTNKKDNDIIFNDFPINVGKYIYVQTGKTLLYGYILGINSKKNISNQEEYLILRINGKEQEFIDLIKIGDRELFNNKTIAEIIDKEIISPKDALRKDILLKVKILTNYLKNEPYYKNKYVSIGSSININTREYILYGEIQNIGDIPLRKNKIEKTIELKVYYEYPFFKNIINIGDKELDSNNRIIAEILDKQIKPSEYVDMDANGNVLVKAHPTRDEITLIIKLQAVQEEDNLVYNDQILKLGSWITIRTPNFNIGGQITKIQ